MLKKVVRCDVCTRVHDVADLLNLVHGLNGRSTFICPKTKRAGTYKLENVGSIHTKEVAELV